MRVMKYGYAGVSTDDQSCAFPLPEDVAAGDTLIVWELDRMGRSLRESEPVGAQIEPTSAPMGPL